MLFAFKKIPNAGTTFKIPLGLRERSQFSRSFDVEHGDNVHRAHQLIALCCHCLSLIGLGQCCRANACGV
jgi:hypothetical protein